MCWLIFSQFARLYLKHIQAWSVISCLQCPFNSFWCNCKEHLHKISSVWKSTKSINHLCFAGNDLTNIWLSCWRPLGVSHKALCARKEEWTFVDAPLLYRFCICSLHKIWLFVWTYVTLNRYRHYLLIFKVINVLSQATNPAHNFIVHEQTLNFKPASNNCPVISVSQLFMFPELMLWNSSKISNVFLYIVLKCLCNYSGLKSQLHHNITFTLHWSQI